MTNSNQAEWWITPTFHEPLFCVYCNQKTSCNENLEHILPESLGNKDTLYRGAVCNDCNHRLGINVDSKIFNEPMAASGHVAQATHGKKGPRTEIGRHVTRTETGVAITGGTSGKDHEFAIARAITKCGVNIFTHYFGSLIVRKQLVSMIQYVVEPRNKEDIWPYACVFTPTGGFGTAYGIESVETDGSTVPIFVFLCASGLFVSSVDRQIPSIEKRCLEYVSNCMKKREESTGGKIVSMTYAANNQPQSCIA